MATTYSFEVKEQGEREDRADEEDKNQNIIVIPTKGCKRMKFSFFCSNYPLRTTIKKKCACNVINQWVITAPDCLQITLSAAVSGII